MELSLEEKTAILAEVGAPAPGVLDPAERVRDFERLVGQLRIALTELDTNCLPLKGWVCPPVSHPDHHGFLRGWFRLRATVGALRDA